MNVRSIVLAATLTPILILTAGCGGKERKSSMRRTSQTEITVTEWAKNVALKGEKGATCFQLDLLVAAIQNQKDKLISVRTLDLDFVVEKRFHEKGHKRRFLFESESGDLAAQKALYFLSGKHRQALLSIGPSSDLGGTPAAELLNVASHEKCADKVIFADKRVFQVDAQNEKFIRLTAVNGTEMREYFINSRGQIQLTHIVAATDVAACGPGTRPNHLVRRRYAINLAEADDSGARLSPGLSKLLNTYVYKFSPDDAKSGSANLNSALLSYMSAQIVAGHVQVSCESAKGTP